MPVQTLAELRAAVAAQGAGAIFDFAAAAGQAGEKNEKGGRSGKDDLGRVLGLLARLYRDALAVAAGAPELAVLRAGGVEGVDALAPLGVERLGRALAAIVDVQAALTANVNATLAIERLLLALKAAAGGVPGSARLQRRRCSWHLRSAPQCLASTSPRPSTTSTPSPTWGRSTRPSSPTRSRATTAPATARRTSSS